jgi:hypothetical protein
MVLGFLLYETVDVGYNLIKLTYNGTTYVYNWYYGIQPETLENEVQHNEDLLKQTQDQIKQLENRIQELEKEKKESNHR